ncbi:MAG: endonuclease [Weeksellaceae bacterium]
MKKQLSIFTLFLSFIMWAQSAPDYYKSIDFSQEGDALKEQLTKLITDTHKNQISYNTLKEVLKTSDADPDKPGNIILFYGSENSGIHERSRSVNGSWNREHVYAQSQGTPPLGKSVPGSDAHHLRSTDIQLNSNRGHLSFADGQGKRAGKNNGGWYPGDEWKGDVARILMYMYVRYENRTQPLNITKGPATYSSDFPDILLKWNVEDPVSNLEINRNNVVADVQKNRNPFIDNPYLATMIWGGPAAANTWPDTINGGGADDEVAPSVPTNLVLNSVGVNYIDFKWKASTDNYAVAGYEIYVDGEFNSKTTLSEAKVTGLSPLTEYRLTVLAYDNAGNKSAMSNALVAKTADNQGGEETTCGTEDFESIISTGGNPPASQYVERQWTNAGITWTATNARTDQSIEDGKAICIRKGSLKSTTIAGGIESLTVTTQRMFNGGSGSYTLLINGEEKGKIPYNKDAITHTIENINVEGDIIIELVDNQFNDRVAFDNLSWTCYTGLGTTEIDNKEVALYPNPITNQVFYITGITTSENVEIYNMQGQLIQLVKGVQNNQPILLSNLTDGIYIVKLNNKTFKIIVK